MGPLTRCGEQPKASRARVRTHLVDIAAQVFSAEGKYSQVLLSLSAFTKKTQKTPHRELDLAEDRLRDWRHRGALKGKTAQEPI